MGISSDTSPLAVDAIPTGSLSLDIALGVGGIPRGCIVEIFGPESSGKTTLAQHIAAETQQLGGTAAFIDMEHALDPTYAAACGVDIDRLLISHPQTGEHALEVAQTLTNSGAVDLIIVDSVAALVPQAELLGEMGEAHLGLMARLMSQALRKLSPAARATNTAIIFTNQLRQKIRHAPNIQETTTGGNALKLHAAIRLDVRCVKHIQSGSAIVGSRILARVVKNKLAAELQTAEFDIMHDEGISKVGDLFDLALNLEIIREQRFGYSFQHQPLGQDRDTTLCFLRRHQQLAQSINSAIRQRYLPPSLMPLEP